MVLVSTHQPSPGVAGTTVPAFVERPMVACTAGVRRPGVAGTTVPAFVERSTPRGLELRSATCVAGTTVPAFVERAQAAAHLATPARCRRDYGPGLR